MGKLIILCFSFLFIFVNIFFPLFNYIKSNRNDNRKKIISGKLMYWKEFEKNWIIPVKQKNIKPNNMPKKLKAKSEGYKYTDCPGCYVITIYRTRIDWFAYRTYENIYVGQSVKVCQRVHNHFNGKGKGDVYADIKYGKYVYVRIFPCSEKDMNDLEKKFIKKYNATKSYNATKGGGKKR